MAARVPQNRKSLTRHECPLCGKVYQTDAPQWKATKQLESRGWKWTMQITESDDWHLICPIHVDDPSSRTIYVDAENRRLEIDLPL